MSDQRTKIHCNYCGHKTWHAFKAAHSHCGTETFTTEDGKHSSEAEVDRGYEIWTCLGCDLGVFRDWWAVDGEFIEERFYPSRTTEHIRAKEFRKLGRKLKTIYGEVIDTFNGGCHILCAAGLRALLEAICNDKGVSGSILQNKIDGLTQFVPANIVQNLHGFRFLGNQALHQLDTPGQEDLGLAIEVVEDVMNVIYELDYKSGRLMQRLSERQQGKAGAMGSP